MARGTKAGVPEAGARPAGRARRRRRRRRGFSQLRRRWLLVVLALAALAFALGALAGGGGESEPEPVGGAADRDPSAPAELPRGGRSLIPDYRVVAYYGAPQDDELGALGIGSPREASGRLLAQARAYRRPGRPVLPALELISTIASASAGADDRYSFRQPRSVIRRYLREARRRRALLILDVQPGRVEFMNEVRALEEFLREPDVGLALDPEWHVGPGEIPGQALGSVGAGVVNEVSAYLDELVAAFELPEKLLVVHQFTDDMITGRERLEDREGVAIVLNSDGFGTAADKIAKYRELRPPPASPLHQGFKLFYREDQGLMSPERVLKLEPSPDLVVYE